MGLGAAADVVLIVLLLSVFHHGPRPSNSQSVVVDMKPDTFLPFVTPLVTLRCSVTSSPGSHTFPTVLVMQLRKIPLPESVDASQSSKKEKKKEKGKATRKHKRESEVIIGVVTNNANAKLNVQDEDNRLDMEGSITAEAASLTFRIKGPLAEDAGQYTCHASALNAMYAFQDFAGAANLTIIGDEGSASLLLAKEQILETQQKHLQEEEVALQEELKRALKKNDELSDRVRRLEAKNDNLTALVNSLVSSVSHLKSKSADDRVGSAGKADSGQFSGNEEALKETKSKLDRLERVVASDLTSRINTLETQFLEDVKKRLRTLEERVSAAETERDLKRFQTVTPETRTEGVNEEKLETVLNKVDQLKQGTLKEISSNVTQIEQNQRRLQVRLDHMEGESIKVLVENVKTLDEQLKDNRDEIEKMKVKLDGIDSSAGEDESKGRQSSQAASTLHIPPKQSSEVKLADTSCYVCGDLTSTIPCSIDDLRRASTQRCPADATFCMNDIYQLDYGRKIYKRCVSEKECRSKHDADRKECKQFNFMSKGRFDCHFCCTSNKCNYNFKPSKSVFKP